MRLLVALALSGALAAALPAQGQPKAAPAERMSEAQRADYQRLMRGSLQTFRVAGRFRKCRLDFDAEPFFREVARRHGADSEPVRIARLAFAAEAENLALTQDVDPTPPAPMPCDVVVYMRGMQLPELPASLAQ